MNPERLRIAMLARAVAPWHGVGGLERHVADMTRHLVRRGVRVTLVTPPPAQQGEEEDAVALPGLDDALRDGRLETRFVPYVTFPFAGRRGTTILDRITAYPYFGRRAGRVAQRLVDEGRAQIVHGLGASALGYAQARARDRIGTVPFIFNPQGLEEFGGTDPSRARLKTLAYRPLRAAVRVCADAADRVIATDDVLAPVVEAHLAVEEDRLHVIPNAVDLDAIDALASATNARGSGATAKDNERAPHGGGDSALLLAVGRLEANKGFHVLIEALARLWVMPGAPACHLVLVGDGPRRSALQRQAQEAGLGGQVHFLGRIGGAGRRCASVVQRRDALRASDAVRGQLARDPRSDGAPVRRRRHRRGRHPRQSEAWGGVTGWLVPPCGNADALAVETHEAVFTWVLQQLADAGLVRGRTVGIDATTLEANAALRSIVRRETGEDYTTFLTRLAEASGIATPTRAELARFDRSRKKKTSNAEWTHPHDPDARVTKMKDGRTHLAHKAEHTVDLETGAVVGVTVQGADTGDTASMVETLIAAPSRGSGRRAVESCAPQQQAVMGQAGRAVVERGKFSWKRLPWSPTGCSDDRLYAETLRVPC